MPTAVTVSVTLVEARRLRAIAEARQLSLSSLVRKALEQTYGTAERPTRVK
jgi:predicted transcriptional regulator